MKLKSLVSSILFGIAGQTPTLTSIYRPAPATLIGQIWAGLTRNTPAFSPRPSEVPVRRELTSRERSERRTWNLGPALKAALPWAAIAAVMITAVVLFFVYSSPNGHHSQQSTSAGDGISFVILAVILFVTLFWRLALKIVALLVVIGFVVGVGWLLAHILASLL
jgi:hypothetical protein